MSDPNGDPPSQSPTPPAEPPGSQGVPPRRPTAPKSPGPSPLPPTPRANPPSVFNQKEAVPSPPAAEPGFSDFLAWMQSRSGEQTAAPAAVPGQRTLLPKEQKKFHRAEAEPKPEKNLSTADPAVTDEDGTAGTDDELDAAMSVIRRRRKTAANERSTGQRWQWSWLWLPLLILLALLFGSFKLGRVTAPAVVMASPVAKVRQNLGVQQNAQVAELIDQAMSAEVQGDYKAATGFLEQARAIDGHVRGLEYHLAQLAFESADFPRAITLLDHCLENAEESAASYSLRGTILNRTTGADHGLDNMEAATRIDPFNARYFFFLGEALRRAGKPQLALVRLRQALDRLQEPALQDVYESKIRLAQIELGQESDFAGQLADELRQTPPSTDWLFTAAALEMHRGHFDAAAEYLDKVSSLVDRHAMRARLNDFYFLSFVHEKPLARFFATNNNPQAVQTPPVADTVTDPPASLDLPIQPRATPAATPVAPIKP